jgi:putative FmdB family regulatory protein
MLVVHINRPPILTLMPTYEYRCTKGHTFDAVQSISDEPLTKCEVCGRPVVRVLHSPAVHFKGSGFYNTDYGTKKRQREKASSESSSSESWSSNSSSSTEKTTTTTTTEKPAAGSTGSSEKPKKS